LSLLRFAGLCSTRVNPKVHGVGNSEVVGKNSCFLAENRVIANVASRFVVFHQPRNCSIAVNCLCEQNRL